MKVGSPRFRDEPLVIVGSNKFGRYNKISVEQTFNMIISDDALVPFAGYNLQSEINATGQGRGDYSSSKLKKMFVSVDNNIWVYDYQLIKTFGGNLQTFTGNVFFAENNSGQVAISDLKNIYIYDNATNTITIAVINFTPGYLTFQNGRFVCPDILTNNWRLSAENNGLSWPADAQHVGAIQTKPDNAVACVRFPGRGNLLLAFGKTVAELWTDVGNKLFPYQRSQSTNIDYGCLNSATIAESDDIVIWLGANEKSGPVIMFTNGGEIKHISTDGIDFKFSQLTNPSNSYGFMFRQDGHIIYVITFPDDNLTYMYDFNTQKFFTLTDEDMNYFNAKRVVFFNGNYYFVSFRDGNLYKLSSNITNYNYGSGNVFEIPRIRFTGNIRQPDQSTFITSYSGFTIEQGDYGNTNGYVNSISVTNGGSGYTAGTTVTLVGNGVYAEAIPVISGGLIQSIFVTNNGKGYTLTPTVVITDSVGTGAKATASLMTFPQRVDLSLSKDGGVNFGAVVSKTLRPEGLRKNRLMWRNLGMANDLVQQFRFYGMGRFVAFDGITGISQ